MGCASLISDAIHRIFLKRPPRIWEAVWWEERTIGDSANFRLIYTPTQHWSGRNIFLDNNRVSFVG